jgi:hypothetical protein
MQAVASETHQEAADSFQAATLTQELVGVSSNLACRVRPSQMGVK